MRNYRRIGSTSSSNLGVLGSGKSQAIDSLLKKPKYKINGSFKPDYIILARIPLLRYNIELI